MTYVHVCTSDVMFLLGLGNADSYWVFCHTLIIRVLFFISDAWSEKDLLLCKGGAFLWSTGMVDSYLFDSLFGNMGFWWTGQDWVSLSGKRVFLWYLVLRLIWFCGYLGLKIRSFCGCDDGKEVKVSCLSTLLSYSLLSCPLRILFLAVLSLFFFFLIYESSAGLFLWYFILNAFGVILFWFMHLSIFVLVLFRTFPLERVGLKTEFQSGWIK